MEAGKRSTLPRQTSAWIDELLSRYEAVFPQASIKEIISSIKESRNTEKRALIELTA